MPDSDGSAAPVESPDVVTAEGTTETAATMAATERDDVFHVRRIVRPKWFPAMRPRSLAR